MSARPSGFLSLSASSSFSASSGAFASLVLVGDPKQLAPVISGPRLLTDAGLGKSLLERLHAYYSAQPRGPTGVDANRAGGRPLGLAIADAPGVVMLEEQFRMHPDIAQLPSQYFYGGRLRAGGKRESWMMPFHQHPLFGP